MSFTIVIAAHGDEAWADLAWSRAYPSAQGQGAEVLIDYDALATRAEVRNRLIEEACGEYIITLDADDQLSPGYVAAMAHMRHIWKQQRGGEFLLTPAVAYMRKGIREQPKFWPEFDLAEGNWMVVGTAAPRNLMLEVGGWREFYGSGVLNEWDDWDMWIRCTQAGAEIVKVPDAIYVAHVSESAHYARTPRMTRRWLREIREANGLAWK